MAEPIPGAGVRIIKRYANRKLYDTGSGELTSLRRVEQLVRDGVEIRVVDHDSGEDMTCEVLVGILGKSVGERPSQDDIPLLISFIRAPGDLLGAMFKDEQRTAEVRDMVERVRLLSATVDALIGQMEPKAVPDEPPDPVADPPRTKKSPAKRSPGDRAGLP